MKGLQGKVVVITGASSGVGRAAAVKFASRGARAVLAARREEALDLTARLCRQAGSEAVVVVTDVAEEAQVQRLADQALASFGRIDVWVNNAGVTFFAPLTVGEFDKHRRVIEVNLYGAMYGARAALPIFRRQKAGVLINVGSILSKAGQAFVPSYVASKFALRGISESLRVELADEPDVHVCSLYPYSIDTPHFQAGGGAIGHPARAVPPVQSPEKVAQAIVELAEHPRRERHVPRAMALGFAVRWLFPKTTERLLLHALREFHFDRSEIGPMAGNLYQPAPEAGEVHGERAPKVGLPRFALWTARELVRIEADAARRRVQQGLARLQV